MLPQSHPPKRLTTEQTFSRKLELEACRDNRLSPDLAVRLQNVGSRVRKNVTEGYATSRLSSAPASPYSSPSKPGSLPKSPPLFQSANDTLHEVRSSGIHERTPSPRKRGRAETDLDCEQEVDGIDRDVELHSDDLMLERIVKPLPIFKRRLLETRSLPDGMLQFRGQSSLASNPDEAEMMDTNIDGDVRDA